MRIPGAVRNGFAIVLAAAMLPTGMPSPLSAEEPGAAPGAIRGSLVDANGVPLSGYRVKVTDAAGAIYQSEPTGADGKFEITGLPAGTYTYLIVDPEGKAVAVKLPPVDLEAGTMVTQPIAIVPRKGRKKGPLIAWLVGGSAAVAALALAGGSNDNDNGGNGQMTSTTLRPGNGP